MTRRRTKWRGGHAAYIIDRVVAKAYGVTTEALKAHGHVAGAASVMALERAACLSGRTPRAMGRYSGLQARLEVLQGKLAS
jgi:hypothetical protein